MFGLDPDTLQITSFLAIILSHWSDNDIKPALSMASFLSMTIISVTRSLGALRAPTSSLGPFGPGLRPSRPSGAQAV